MEIQLLPKNSLRIKGKHGSVVIDPQEKVTANAAVLVGIAAEQAKLPEDTVTISGPGEYEVSGIKLTGLQAETDAIYTISVDSIDILLGKINALEKMQHKLKDHAMVIVIADIATSASFVTSLADNAILFYGEKAAETVQSFGKENVKQMGKYAVTLDKLPAEVETILLA